MLRLRDGVKELIRKVATSLPRDVEEALQKALESEPDGSPSKDALRYILENASVARASARPLCQDTGIPAFYVQAPKELGFATIRESIVEGVREATRSVPLRANAVDILTEKNTDDNTGEGIPEFSFEQTAEGNLVIDICLRGAGAENSGTCYKLPDERLRADRDFEGVRRCVLDAVHSAQGRGCPPYTIGVGIAGTRLTAARLSRAALMRKLDDRAPADVIAALEESTLADINRLGIGALGLGGRCTALAVKINHAYRHTGSYFVDVSFACWANRRGRLIW